MNFYGITPHALPEKLTTKALVDIFIDSRVVLAQRALDEARTLPPAPKKLRSARFVDQGRIETAIEWLGPAYDQICEKYIIPSCKSDEELAIAYAEMNRLIRATYYIGACVHHTEISSELFKELALAQSQSKKGSRPKDTTSRIAKRWWAETADVVFSSYREIIERGAKPKSWLYNQIILELIDIVPDGEELPTPITIGRHLGLAK